MIKYILFLIVFVLNTGQLSVTMAEAETERVGKNYTIQPVNEKDVDAVTALLARTFFIDEPLNAAVKLCEGVERCTEVEEYCKESLLEGLSFKAVDKEGNIVGVMISGVISLKDADKNGNDLLSQAQKCLNLKFKKILFILAERELGARLWKKFPNDDKLVEVKVAATDPNWRRKGIMNELLRHTENATISRNIRLLRMDTSSEYSAKSAERLHFTSMRSVKYEHICQNGVPLILPEPPHVYDRVFVKELFKLDEST